MLGFYRSNFLKYDNKSVRVIFHAFFVMLFFYSRSFCFNPSDTLEFSTAFLSQNDTIIVAILANIPENYHLYSNPKGPGIGKDLQVSLKDENTAEILFAKKQIPQNFLPEGEPKDQWVWAWENEAVIFLAFSPESQFPLEIKIEGVYCDISCIPFSKNIEVFPDKSFFDDKLKQIYSQSQDLPIKGKIIEDFSPETLPQNYTMLSAILFAFIAGIILNFMPCVLPVLGIKILSFTDNTSKRIAVLRSLAFSAGIIFVFLLLALITIQAKIWWGQQFQNPIFITVLSIIMLVGALFLFDIFVISPNSKIAELEMKQDKSSLAGNFIRGIFATILATPCSGPFLGAIMAWAIIDNSPTAVFAVFLSVAAGMSAPYILLSVIGGAKISRKIGKYSVIIKRILGVILLIFAGFLFYSANSQNLFKTKTHTTKNSIWQPFSQELFENAQRNRQSVIINFTANWCLNCQYNKITVYETKEIHEILKEKNVLALTADLTNENLPAQMLMEELNAKSIPFLAIFDGNHFTSPIVFYDIVSKKSVIKALE